MANYKKYQVIGASNYEVNKIGQVFNKHGRRLTPRKDGRYELVSNFGYKTYITPGVEYLKALYDTTGYPGRYDMIPAFPRYMVDRDANIFHVLRPYEPIATDSSEGVQIVNEYGNTVRINRFRALAVYGFKQPDTGYVRVIDTIYDGEECIDISNTPLSDKRVKMIHPSLMNVRVEILDHHDLAVCYSPDGKSIVLKQWDTGTPIPYSMDEFEGRMFEEGQLTLNNMKYHTKEFYESKNMIYNTVEDWQVEEDDVLLEEVAYMYKDETGNKRFIIEVS